MNVLPDTIVEIIGWIGVLSYVTAYGLLSMGRMKAERVNYHVLNAVGGGCLIILSYHKGDMPNLFVNLIWAFIAFVSITRLLIKRK